jgi:hypothetical protein
MERRPGLSCWTGEQDEASGSTISNDMLTGYFLALFQKKDLDGFIRRAEHGEKNSFQAPGWVMGQPFPAQVAKVLLRPNGVSLVGRAMFTLSRGQIDKYYRNLPPFFGLQMKDYEFHIQAIGILTEGLIREHQTTYDVTEFQFQALKVLADTMRDDGFIQAVYGRYADTPNGGTGTAIKLLTDPNYRSPSYVRGHESYHLIHWLAAARTILDTVHSHYYGEQSDDE